jgi:hypothetical protein
VGRFQRNRRGEPRGAPFPPRNILVAGPARSIAFARKEDGSEPARDFYDSLTGAERTKFDALFTAMADTGSIRNSEKFRPRVGEATCNHNGVASRYPVAEFKVHLGAGTRILAVLDRDQFVLTHGFTKGANLPVEVKKAERIFCYDVSRPRESAITRGAQ